MSNLAKALLAFQKDAPPIVFDATNPHFRNRYASLAGVVAAVRPVLNKHGLVCLQIPTNLDGHPALRTVLTHAESGEEISDVTPLILSKQDAQAFGSALTYARRYALLSMLNLVGDDDDDATHAVGGGHGAQGDPATTARRVLETPAPSTPDPHGLQASRGDVVEPGQVIVPFGKHKGQQVKDVPSGYWEWWLAQDGQKNEQVLVAVQLHLGLTAEPAKNLDEDIPF